MVKKENKLSWMMLFIPVYLLILYQGFSHQVSSSNYAVFLYIFFVLAAIGGIIVEIRKKMALDRQREAAARGELQQGKIRLLLDVPTLSLPTRFQYLPSKGQWSFFLYFSTVFLLILEIVFMVGAFNPGDPFRDLHTQMAITLPIMGLALWIGTYLFRSTQWFLLTENGVTKRTLIGKTTIRWQDARLFATHASTYPNASFWGKSEFFELSSSRNIIHWAASHHVGFGLFIRKTSYETYEQQMQGLLATIEAKTGLKCYDLSV